MGFDPFFFFFLAFCSAVVGFEEAKVPVRRERAAGGEKDQKVPLNSYILLYWLHLLKPKKILRVFSSSTALGLGISFFASVVTLLLT